MQSPDQHLKLIYFAFQTPAVTLLLWYLTRCSLLAMSLSSKEGDQRSSVKKQVKSRKAQTLGIDKLSLNSSWLPYLSPLLWFSDSLRALSFPPVVVILTTTITLTVLIFSILWARQAIVLISWQVIRFKYYSNSLRQVLLLSYCTEEIIVAELAIINHLSHITRKWRRQDLYPK